MDNTPDLQQEVAPEPADYLRGIHGGSGKRLKAKYDAPAVDKPSNLDTAWQTWQQQQDDESMRQVLRAADGTINAGIKSYAPNSTPAMRSRAKILTRRAIQTYDPNKGTKLKTHIMNNLQPLRRESMAYNTLHTPERVRMDLYAVNQKREAFEMEHGRAPSDEELADFTGLSKKRINHIRMYDKRPVFETALQAQSEGDKRSMPGVIPEDDLWTEFVYEGLSSSDQRIYDMKTGYGGSKDPQSVSEIARELNMSPSAVSQRLAKIDMELAQGAEFRGM
jgi:DNA-directed RNA polymerase specialized sigma subunit